MKRVMQKYTFHPSRKTGDLKDKLRNLGIARLNSGKKDSGTGPCVSSMAPVRSRVGTRETCGPQMRRLEHIGRRWASVC